MKQTARATALGAAIAVAHAAGFAALAGRCRGGELAVEVTGPPAAPQVALAARLPAALADRVAIDDATGPLHRRRWTVRYRGGAERSVGAVQLVGPLQDPGAARCVGRIVVGQRLLDDGRAGPGTIAAAMLRELDAELRGATVFPAGELVRIDGFALAWAELAHHPEDRALIDDATGDSADHATGDATGTPADLAGAQTGYVRGAATLVFERVAVPVRVALIPVRSPRELRLRVAAHAELAFESRALQWLSDRLGGNRLATHLARRQVDDALITALAPPPPFPLPGGQSLQFTYCDEPASIVDGSHGALPFGVALGRAPDPRILPPALGRGPRGAPAPATQLALDLDLDALNAVLYELWRTGWLDRRLAAAGLDRRFNTDPTVRALLSVRLAPPTLTLPPVVTAAPGGLRLAAEAQVAIHDGASVAAGRLWGGLAFRFAYSAVEPVAVDLGELELSCERAATGDTRTLVPCYGDLVAAVRGRAGELHGALTTSFVQLISDIFVGRLTARGVAADLEIRRATPSVASTASTATLHLELDAAIDPTGVAAPR